MEETRAAQAELMKRFAGVVQNIRAPRARRVFADVGIQDLPAVFSAVVDELGFAILCTITGLDLSDSFGVIYHLARESGVVLNLATKLPKDNPQLQSVTGRFPAADLYEREMVDLLGIQVNGLGPGPRYPLPDDFPAGQYPLRKDWVAPGQAGKAAASEGKDG